MILAGCGPAQHPAPAPASEPAHEASLAHPDERHFGAIVQLTRASGENAEAYWSSGGDQLVFQSKRPPYDCDQIFRMPADGSGAPQRLSSGRGRTTCSYFVPGDARIIYATTQFAGDGCPEVPDMSQGYVWPIYADYDIVSVAPDGSDLKRLTTSAGYDAEATICPRDGSIVFTSTRDGDLDLYRMNADGSSVARLTDTPGYDGGAFFSADCSKLVWRASRPDGDALEDYRRLLAQGLVRPGKLEIYVANADGSDARQITYLDAASFAPYFFPNGERVVFSSNYGDPRGREFDLWGVDIDGTDLERITFSPGFDGFPMFSPDGTKLVFASNRNQAVAGETDVYVAEWTDAPPAAEPSAADRFLADAAWLADPERKGRGVGTPELDAAGAFIEQRLVALGLAPGYGQGYRHGFEIAVDVARDEATALAIDGTPVEAARFVPAGASASAAVNAQTVFVGWGITDPERGIDDYANRNVKGKIAVARRFAPSTEAFADEERRRRFGDLHYKAWNAREHGAIGLLVVDLADDQAPLPALRLERHGDAAIPVAVVDASVGARLARGRHRVALKVALERRMATAYNVVGKVEAGGDRLPGAVVLGAHYDHLGMGGEGSLAPGVSAPHLGADDNASGVAALLEATRQLQAARATLRRDVYIVAFSAEEAGVLGSSAFVEALPPGLEPGAIVAMINMDMVGRLRGNTLAVLGGESAAEWGELVEPTCRAAGVRCSLSGSGYGPSDHTPFYAAGAPVLHLFTGNHGEYHTPRDAPALLNAAGGARIASIAASVAMGVAGRAARLTYRKLAAPAPMGDVRSYGASLGTIPDYAAGDGERGVVLAGVRPGGPAEAAGLERGDRIVAIGGREIASIRDLMYVLQAAKPGQTATVVVLRGGQRVELSVTYGERAQRE
jgi:Tol biopolymer transport system component